MNPAISDFFQAGRKLRSQTGRGSVLLIESDFSLREVVEHWAHMVGVFLCTCSEINQAMYYLNNHPKCLIFGMDNQDYLEAKNFLEMIDKHYPYIISIVTSSDPKCVEYLKKDIPRLTTIVKGKGLKDLLMSTLPRNYTYEYHN